MEQNGALLDKVSVITGGSRGIGRSIAQAFAKEGSKVVLASKSEEKLREVAAEIESAGGTALAIPADLSQRPQAEQMIEASLRAFGRIDVLVNNAGQIATTGLKDSDVEEWERIIKVNLLGTYYCSRAVLPAMVAQNQGRIINISSTAGRSGFPNRSAYCASKFGVSGMSESLAQEIQESPILVSTICPGMVETDMARQSRPGADTTTWLKPLDIAEVALFLATRPAHVLIPEVVVLARALDYFRQ